MSSLNLVDLSSVTLSRALTLTFTAPYRHKPTPHHMSKAPVPRATRPFRPPLHSRRPPTYTPHTTVNHTPDRQPQPNDIPSADACATNRRQALPPSIPT